jgi:hypothetical protein
VATNSEVCSNTLRRCGIEPSEPAPQQFQFEAALPHIMIIEVADLKLVLGQGFQCGSGIRDFLVVKVKSDDS